MSAFDTVVHGAPPLVLEELRRVIDAEAGAASTETGFQIPLGFLEGARFDQFSAKGRFVPNDQGVRVVGEFHLTAQTKAAYGVAFAVVLGVSGMQLLARGQWAAWLLACLLGGAVIGLRYRFARFRMPAQGNRRLQALFQEAQAVADLHAG